MGTKERFSDGFFYTRRIKRKVFLTIGFYILLYTGDFVNHYIPVPSPEEEVCEDKIYYLKGRNFK